MRGALLHSPIRLCDVVFKHGGVFKLFLVLLFVLKAFEVGKLWMERQVGDLSSISTM